MIAKWRPFGEQSAAMPSGDPLGLKGYCSVASSVALQYLETQTSTCEEKLNNQKLSLGKVNTKTTFRLEQDMHYFCMAACLLSDSMRICIYAKYCTSFVMVNSSAIRHFAVCVLHACIIELKSLPALGRGPHAQEI